MNKLGRLMKDDLTTVSCVAESSEHTFHVQCVVYVSSCVQSRPGCSSHTCMCLCVQSRPLHSSNTRNMFMQTNIGS